MSGLLLKFPKGSKCIECEWDVEATIPLYQRPDGSL